MRLSSKLTIVGFLGLVALAATDVKAAEAISLAPVPLSLVDGELVQGEIIEASGVDCASLYTFELPGREMLIQCITTAPALRVQYFSEASDGIHPYATIEEVAHAYWPDRRYLNSAQRGGDEFVVVFASN